MIRFPGTVLDEATAEFIRTNSIRGVCLFRGNMTDSDQLGKLTADLRAVLGPDALLAIDHEGGAHRRIDAGDLRQHHAGQPGQARTQAEGEPVD
eukprot:gene2156-3062_t